MLPNFLIVGAEKAGTTTLAFTLAEHPEAFMCEPKEPRFFINPYWDRGLSWYESLFRGAVDHKAIGEASPAYTWAPEYGEAPKRIYECLGDIRYIYAVRDPVQRMISHYRHALYYRWVPDDTPFETALELRPELKNCSRYFYQIEQYLPYTRPEQWHIVVLEELIEDYQSEANAMFRFLEISEMPLARLPAENVSDDKVRPPMLFHRIKPLQRYLPDPVVRLGRELADKLGKRVEKPDTPESVYDDLMEELKPDIDGLTKFCGKDFRAIWRIN